MAYWIPGCASRIISSNRLTMGAKSGITRRIQSSMSAWLSDGTGGFRVVLRLRGFIARSPQFGRHLDPSDGDGHGTLLGGAYAEDRGVLSALAAMDRHRPAAR